MNQLGFLVILLYAMASSVALAKPGTLVVGAVGDSISTGFNAAYWGDNRNLSWSTGKDARINSHFKRFAELHPESQVKAVNIAIPASQAKHLAGQVSYLMHYEPDYVTVTTGANDVCTWKEDYAEDLQEFTEDLRAQVGIMVETKSTIKILLTPVPNLYNLWQVASKKPSCQAKWDLVGICRLLLSSSSDEASRQGFVGRWLDINAAIAQVAAEYPENVLYNPEIANTDFEWGQISPKDCFHPSINGLNLIAEKTWMLSEESAAP